MTDERDSDDFSTAPITDDTALDEDLGEDDPDAIDEPATEAEV